MPAAQSRRQAEGHQAADGMVKTPRRPAGSPSAEPEKLPDAGMLEQLGFMCDAILL